MPPCSPAPSLPRGPTRDSAAAAARALSVPILKTATLYPAAMVPLDSDAKSLEAISMYSSLRNEFLWCVSFHLNTLTHFLNRGSVLDRSDPQRNSTMRSRTGSSPGPIPYCCGSVCMNRLKVDSSAARSSSCEVG